MKTINYKYSVATFCVIGLLLFISGQSWGAGWCGEDACNAENRGGNGSSEGSQSSSSSGGIDYGKAAAIGAGAALLFDLLQNSNSSSSSTPSYQDNAEIQRLAEEQRQRQQKEEEDRFHRAAQEILNDELYKKSFPDGLGNKKHDRENEAALQQAMQNCPYDATALPSIMTNEGKDGMEQAIIDLIDNGGGTANAMAMLAAQKTKYLAGMREAEKTAKSTFGGQGTGAAFGDPLAYNCPEGDKAYCSANHMYWMSKDGLALTDYQIKALNCYRKNGVN